MEFFCAPSATKHFEVIKAISAASTTGRSEEMLLSPKIKEEYSMQDILKEYGPALITVVAIITLIALITFLIGKDGDSVVGSAFSQLITNFFESANSAAGIGSAAQSAATSVTP